MSPASKSTTAQPQSNEMKVMTAAEVASTHQHQHQNCEHDQAQGKASRLRGGGAGKDCFLGMIGCFLCFECCEGCCHCVGDIICCPCEVCC